MNKVLAIIMTAGMLGSAGLAARAEEPAADKGEGKAVFCPKCEAVWVMEPRVVGKTTVYVKTKKVCEECTTAVANYFKTGKFGHTCTKCGDMTACSASSKSNDADTKADAKKPMDGAHQHHLTHPKP